ncbi:MAG: Eco57I restriction-modification methylase domain-containing protein [Promethearchaeota archaeon]
MKKALMGKELGVVLTPSKTAEYIVSKLGTIKKGQTILDPCVGPGIFVETLIKAGVNRNQIHAYDIDPTYETLIENLGVRFKNLDNLLSINPERYGEFDFVVGNPPYLNKASSYVRNNRKRLKQIYGKINAHETYAMFIVNGIWRLKDGGRLGFIASDSFLSLRTHTRLREFILENCLIIEILLAPKHLFSDQKVSTNPAIIILEKCSGKLNQVRRNLNIMRIVPRVKSENDYFAPKRHLKIDQENYYSLPFKIFYVDVEEEIVKMFETAPKLEDFLKGYIGMHTHDNRKYIAAVKNTTIALNFEKKNRTIKKSNQKYRIISENSLKLNAWKPYLKRGGSEQYFRPISEALDWSEKAIKIYDIPKNVPFEKEGIVISGVSSRLAARYMPNGCYWDSNKAIGFILKDKALSIPYVLGLLNSSFYNYLAKGIINNTNSIQISGIHSLPFILPKNRIKNDVEEQVIAIMEKKREDYNYDYIEEQRKIDTLIFNFYAQEFGLPHGIKQKIDSVYSIYARPIFS